MDGVSFEKIVFGTEELKSRIAELGRQITLDYAGRELVLVGVLKGSLYFLTDLSREIDLPLQLDLISLGIFQNSTGGKGAVRLTKDLDTDIAGKHVLIVEDIIRSGLTTGYLMQTLEARGAASIGICTLLLSPDEQLIGIPISYVGFEVSKARLLGYGLDVGEKGRNLPFIAEI